MKHFIGVTSIMVAIAIVAFLTLTQKEIEEEQVKMEKIQVSTKLIKTEKITDTVVAHGQVKARWETTLASEVNGRITHVSKKFLSGMSFDKGEVLAIIDDTSYRAALADARASFANAERLLQEERKRAEIAQGNWQSSGLSGAASDLVLRKPQLAEAQATLRAAKVAVDKASYDLAQTKITAPYGGVIIGRQINPGDFVQMGSVIGQIYDQTIYEVRVPLSLIDITRLPENAIGQAVTVSVNSKQQNWTGQISRIEQVIDAQNRWQNVVIELSEAKDLLPGTFVQVDITGRDYDRVFAVPEYMSARDGYMWYVDAQERLQRFMPEILFQNNGVLFVRAPNHLSETIRITVGRDLFLPNIAVDVIEEEKETTELAERKS